MKSLIIFSLVICLFLPHFESKAEQIAPDHPVSVLDNDQKQKFHRLLLSRLNQQFDSRRMQLGQALQNKEALLERQKYLKESYRKLLGKLPPKTPLNATTTGVIDCGDYIIEKVAYESRPNFHVTANFYLPKVRNGKIPGIYIMSGHSDVGKAAETYHTAAILFALNGFAVLVSDPVCQGERFQAITNNGKQTIPGLTTNHTLLDVPSMLIGTDIVSYELWDNIVGLDYLASRSEVDASRLGITGNSGGGTQVTYLAGFDERVKAIAPACYIASFETKFNGIGTQDGCQQLHDEGIYGLEEQDLLFLAAPVPVRILAAEEDFFEIAGALKAAEELKQMYTCLGFPERTDIAHFPGKHGFSRPLRESSVSWMKRWLMDDTAEVKEPENLKIYSPEELQVTSTGQVLSYFTAERSITDINVEDMSALQRSRKTLQAVSYEEMVQKVKKCIRYEEFDKENISVSSNGYADVSGIRAEKIFISRPGGSTLPGLLFRPAKKAKNQNLILLLNDREKTSEAAQGGIIRKELEKGSIVLTVDLSNRGELLFKNGKYMNDGFWNEYLALFNGKPVFTWQVEDVLSSVSAVEKYLDLKKLPVRLIAKGELCPVAIHAAFLDKNIHVTELVTPAIRSWKDLVRNPYVANGLSLVVSGVLNHYDLPDLEKKLDGRLIYL